MAKDKQELIDRFIKKRSETHSRNVQFYDELIHGILREVGSVEGTDAFITLTLIPGCDVATAARLAFHICGLLKYKRVEYMFNGIRWELNNAEKG